MEAEIEFLKVVMLVTNAFYTLALLTIVAMVNDLKKRIK